MTIVETRQRRAGTGRRRETALDAAVTVLVERGYEGTRFKDVAAVSGIAVSTLQVYFGSREDMLVEALLRSTASEVEAMERSAGQVAGGSWERLSALVDYGLNTPVRAWRMLMEFWGAAAHDDELRRHSETLAARYRAPFADVINAGSRAGDFVPVTDVDAIVDVLIATLDGRMVPTVLALHTQATDAHRGVVHAQLRGVLGVRS